MGLGFKIKACVVGLLLSSLCFASEPLFRLQEEEALRDLLSWFEGMENGKPRFPSSEYFVLGVGASPAVIVDFRNALVPNSAAVVPFSGAADAVHTNNINVQRTLRGYFDEKTSEEKMFEWKRDKKKSYAAAMPQSSRVQFGENVRAAIGDKLNGRKILMVDLTMDGSALIMAKENLQWLFPNLQIEALALDDRGDFIPPDPSYKVHRLNSGTLVRAGAALSTSKMYTAVPGWDVTKGTLGDRFGRAALSALRTQRYKEWILDTIVSTPALLDAHWRGVGCEAVFGSHPRRLEP